MSEGVSVSIMSINKRREEAQTLDVACLDCLYLLLVQREIGEASSTEGLNMFWALLQNGTKIKDGCFTLTQQGVTPCPLQQRLCGLATFRNKTWDRSQYIYLLL